MIADWTAAGAVLDLKNAPYKFGTPRAETEVCRSRHVQLGVALERSGVVMEHRDAVDAAVEALASLGDVATTRTGSAGSAQRRLPR